MFVVVCLTALIASGLTLFSGFGLGTLLLPAFAFFFPIPIAVAMTAWVHLANNLFKLILFGRHADLKVALRFGITALPAAYGGAWLLLRLEGIPVLMQYQIGQTHFEITYLKLAIALVMAVFAILELIPAFNKLTLAAKWLPLGGLLSGFFGGFSGHQGALRSVFLLRTGLSKEAFIGTGVVLACLIDFVRLIEYWERWNASDIKAHLPLLLAAMTAAFLGAYLGAKWFKKATLTTVQRFVSALLLLLAILLAIGFI